MKIVKVIHEDISEADEVIKQSFSLQTCNLGNFFKRHDTILYRKSRRIWKEDFLHYQQNKEFVKEVIPILSKDISEQSENLEIISIEKAREKYPKTSNLSIGTYTLHPYDGGRLARLEHYHKNLALEKDDELITLLGKMGAKTLKIIERNVQHNSGSGGVKAETIPADAKTNLNLSQQSEKIKELIVTFEGNIVEIDSDLLRNSLWFSSDSRLGAIFESRRFISNKIQKYTLKNIYTETFDFDFKLAAKYLTVRTDLEAEYHFVSKKERFFNVEFGE
ncbi:hypothetical protein [Desulfonema magnum]|uniref:Uncharacterized protein n=1 Tax=Desulfonema magnum TaxID=45655 RepID=A0A975GPG4_9BACT|nr:hypothetical protein [Desulfonema magnum]QTA88976.1 Uncharacterized protein dnm_050210 [Desulfonema magnum]